MEGKKLKPRVILVFGAPCSGKTTFAEKFANKYDLAFYNLAEVQEKYQFSRETLMEVLGLIANTRKTLVLEGGIDAERDRQEIRQLFRKLGYDAALIWVQTDIATIRSRMKARYKTVAEARRFYDTAVEAMEAPTTMEKPIILSGKHTFETQTKHVLAGLADDNKR